MSVFHSWVGLDLLWTDFSSCHGVYELVGIGDC